VVSKGPLPQGGTTQKHKEEDKELKGAQPMGVPSRKRGKEIRGKSNKRNLRTAEGENVSHPPKGEGGTDTKQPTKSKATAKKVDITAAKGREYDRCFKKDKEGGIRRRSLPMNLVGTSKRGRSKKRGKKGKKPTARPGQGGVAKWYLLEGCKNKV